MRKRQYAVVGAMGLAAVLALAGCSNGNSGSSSGSEKGKTLNVWLMQNTLTPDSQKQIVKQFEDQTGATLKISIQQWDNINTKMTTALATDTPPDVVEIGNTDVPLFAANGALADITSEKSKLDRGGKFLTGLEGPATVDGKLYAAPFYGGARAVVYNTKMWADAGITSAPKSWDEFTSDLDKVAATNTAADFSPIYVSGTYWYGGFSFVTDAGGSIATEKNGKWTSGLTSAAAEKGLGQFKDFQNKYSTTASRTAPLDTPDPNAVFGTGKTSALLGNGNSLSTIVTTYPALKGQVSSFPLPSENHPGANAPTYLGGSDLGIAAKSKNKDLAQRFLEMITSPSVQINQLTKLDGHMPVTDKLIDKVTPSIPAEQRGFFTSAKKSYSTPATPGWATIETDQSVLAFFSEVCAGTSTVQQSAETFSTHLTKALNGNGTK
jgi:N,N'-diacetylchitobiose transport system substrate-binding protein